MSSRLLLVSNPSASRFTGAGFREVRDILSRDFQVVEAWPQGPEETRSLTAEAAGEGFDVVVAMGGDGVVHHAANGLVGSATALAVVPAGTTNVLARVLGLPGRPHPAAAAVAHLPTLPTALAQIATDSPGGARSEYATFAVGIGFDAGVVERAERFPHRKLWFGGVHYARSAVATLLSEWRKRPPDLRVTCDGDRVDAVAVLAEVHHPYTYFGPLPLHLTPDPHPGMAAFAVERLPVLRSAEIFLRAVARRPVPPRLGGRVWQGFDKLVVEADPPAPFQADGELLGRASWIEIVPVPDAVLVRRPAEPIRRPRISSRRRRPV